MPNETWQSDFTHYRLTSPTARGPTSRSSPGSTTTPATPCTSPPTTAVTGPIVAGHVPRKPLTRTDIPASTLTDNGMVYTARLRRRPRRPQPLEHELRRLDIVQKNSRPNHPTTCGKVERFQQTLKKWLRAQPDQPATIAELQALLDTFVDEYNHHRPHRSLPHRATPAAAYQATPQSHPDRRPQTPTPTTASATTRVDKAGNVTLRVTGRLHHIGIGRTYARTRVILLVQDLDIRVINAATGELLRDLTIDPDPGLPTPHPEMTEQPNLRSVGPAVADVLRHHTGGR